MRAAAKQLEFERAAALRDEIQQIRLRVLEQDQSIIVGRAAERAASEAHEARRSVRAGGAGRRPEPAKPAFEVTSIEVLPAEEEPAATLDGQPGAAEGEGELAGVASDWLPGIRDEHEDEGGWQARWLDRPTWDRTVTPNVRKRTGQRPGQRPGRGRPRGY